MAPTGTDAARPTIEIPARPRGLGGPRSVSASWWLLAAALAYPLIASSYWTFVVTLGFVLAMSCMGLLVVGWVGDLSLMQAGLTGTATYTTGSLYLGFWTNDNGYSIAFSAMCGIVFVVGISLLVALVSARLTGLYVIVLTLSVQFGLENTVFLEERFNGGLRDPAKGRPEFLGLDLNRDKAFYFFVLGVLAVSMLLLERLRYSRSGRAMIFVGFDSSAAASVGVSVPKYRIYAFGVAGLFAGVAGAVSSALFFSPPGSLQYVSFNSIFYLSIPILAGFESVTLLVGIAVAFTVFPQLLVDWKLNVYLLGGVGLAVGVLLGPRGLGGRIADLFDARSRLERATLLESHSSTGGRL